MEKKIAKIIQLMLVVIIFFISYSTYQSIKNNSSDNKNHSKLDGSESSCPARIKRVCIGSFYSSQDSECQLESDECNFQNNLKFCYQYSWKNKSTPNYCRDCNGQGEEKSIDKILIECKAK